LYKLDELFILLSKTNPSIFVLDPVLIIYSATSFRHFFLSPLYHKIFTLWLVIFINIIRDVIFFIRKKVFHWYCLVSLLPFNVKSLEKKNKKRWISAYFKRKRLVNTLFRGKKKKKKKKYINLDKLFFFFFCFPRLNLFDISLSQLIAFHMTVKIANKLI